jgi:hypothetical protein
MSRRDRKPAAKAAPAKRPAIDPGGVYTQGEAAALLRMKRETFRALGLPCRRTPGRCLYLGQVLMEWVRGEDARAEG